MRHIHHSYCISSTIRSFLTSLVFFEQHFPITAIWIIQGYLGFPPPKGDNPWEGYEVIIDCYNAVILFSDFYEFKQDIQRENPG
jgi:hypothetical protein